jgi:predicted nucleic acid-binding protein
VILVDTSIWIDHLRRGDPSLVTALELGRVLIHPFVVGELACGTLNRRAEILTLLRELPPAPVATDDEALEFIERRGLMGRGIGYVDVHLLASVALAGDARLWTRDKRLAAVASKLALAVAEPP